MKKTVYLVIILLLLVSCGGSDNEANGLQETLAVMVETQKVSRSTEAAAGVQSQSTQEVAELPTATEEVSAGISLGFSLGSPTLQASDPSTVSLTTGNPQVIEYFAYW